MSEQPKHTPGPWEFDGSIYIFARASKDQDGLMVADTFNAEDDDEAILARIRGVGRGATREEQCANGRLISAAPTMKAALQRILSLGHVLAVEFDDDDSKMVHAKDCSACIAEEALKGVE